MNQDQVLQAIAAHGSLLPFADSGDAAGLLAAINAKIIERTDHTLYGPARLLQRLPAEVVGAAAQVFQAAAEQSALMKMLYDVFVSDGFDFALDATRINVDLLVQGGMPSEVGNALKSVGIWQESIADGFGADATLEVVQAAVSKRLLRAFVASRAALVQAAIEEGTVANEAAAKALFVGA